MGQGPNAYQQIFNRQRHWLLGINQRLFAGNLFRIMDPRTRAEFEAGDGRELGGDGRAARIHSLVSSAALACNFFDYWRQHGVNVIARACGCDQQMTSLSFEQKYPTGLKGKPPNLDVVLTNDIEGGKPVAIESKFAEFYRSEAKNEFAPAYFNTPGLWNGLPNSQLLAQNIQNGGEPGFERLHAAQLLKHALGLSKVYGREGFRLLYLWYEQGGPEADTHVEELKRFCAAIGNEFDFRHATYQSVFAELQRQPGLRNRHEGYFQYMEGRYFSPQ